MNSEHTKDLSFSGKSVLYGQEMVDRILNDVDFLPIVQTAVIDCRVATPEHAFSALEGFLQWFSLLPLVSESDNYVMLKGDVDHVWHAAIINTAIYRHICEEYLGKFIDHHPSLATPKADWIMGTVDRLESVFGTAMHPVFHEWRAQCFLTSKNPENAKR